jgi:hypothetical protein
VKTIPPGSMTPFAIAAHPCWHSLCPTLLQLSGERSSSASAVSWPGAAGRFNHAAPPDRSIPTFALATIALGLEAATSAATTARCGGAETPEVAAIARRRSRPPSRLPRRDLTSAMLAPRAAWAVQTIPHGTIAPLATAPSLFAFPLANVPAFSCGAKPRLLQRGVGRRCKRRRQSASVRRASKRVDLQGQLTLPQSLPILPFECSRGYSQFVLLHFIVRDRNEPIVAILSERAACKGERDLLVGERAVHRIQEGERQ